MSDTGPARLGAVLVPRRSDRARWLDRVRAVDDLGFDTLLTTDHLGIWPPFSPLVAAVEASDRLRFGVQVLNVGFWNPALLAREAAAADVLTDGRLELGFGAGHARDEFVAAGLEYPSPGERVGRLAQVVPAVQRLLSGAHLDDGTAGLGAGELGIRPAQDPVPVMVGGNGDRVLSIAARYAEIVSFVGFTSGAGQTHADLSHFTWGGLAERIAHVRRSAGARFADIELSVLIQAVEITDGGSSAATEAAIGRGLDPEIVADSPFFLTGSGASVAESMARLGELGVTYLTTFEPSAAALARSIGR